MTRKTKQKTSSTGRPLIRVRPGGRVTLPAAMRRRLGWSPGDILKLEVIDGAFRLTKPETPESQRQRDPSPR